MNDATAKQIISTYIDGWVTGNREMILNALDDDCVIIECYGPTYRGTDMVRRWIDMWFGKGDTVNSRNITSFYVADDTCFFEWAFECTVNGTRDGFEGASVVRFRDGKIVFLREYATTAKRYEWHG